MSYSFGGVSGEIERVLSSIDPELLKEPTVNTDDDSDGDTSESELETNIDPSLLKELQDLAVDSSEHENFQPVPAPTVFTDSNEDPEILKELALLSGVEYSPPKPNSDSIITLGQVQQRQYQLKTCAVAFKKNGDINKAKHFLIEAKKLDSAIEFLSNGLPLEPNFVLPTLPDISLPLAVKVPTTTATTTATPNISLTQHPKSPTVSLKQTQIALPNSTMASKEPNFTLADQFDHIIGKLEAQAEEASKLAQQFYRLGDRSNALRFQRYKKGFLEQSKKVQTIRLQPSPSLPFLRQEEVSYSLPQEELDVGPNSLELLVARGRDLAHPQLGVQLPDSYIQYTLGYVPPGAPNGNTGYSPVVYRSADPEYNFSVLLGVDSTRAWQRYAERKSLTIEVFHYRGMLFRSWSLGKISVPLAPLLKNPIINKAVELLHPTTRKPTGARLELRLRLRRAIIAQPPSKVKLHWEVVIEKTDKAYVGNSENIKEEVTSKESGCNNDNEAVKHLSSNVPSSCNLGDTSESIINNIKSQEEIATIPHSAKVSISLHDSQVASEAHNVIPESTKHGSSEGFIRDDSPLVNQEATSVEDPKDQVLSEFYDLSRILSKPVIEMELERLSSDVNPPGPLPSNLTEWDSSARHSELNLQLQMLEIKAQLGQLDPSEYLSNLHLAIVNHKKLAVKLKQYNFLSLARIVLNHIRTMQGEVDELVSMGIA